MGLHIINKTDVALWHACTSALTVGDTLLLIEDAVLAALPHYCDAVQIPSAVQVLALADDLAVRGISARIRAGVQQASWQDFVALSLQHDKVTSWN